LSQAAVAAAMDYEVEVICTGAAGRLMGKGVAAALPARPGASMTVHDLICQAHEAGARFFACPANLEASGIGKDDLIAECVGLVGSAYMIEQVMERDDVRVLTY